MREDPYRVFEVRCDTSQKDSSKANGLLERVASQVQPVMHKHSWTVPLLSELNSKNGRLWGLNVGGGGGRTQEIKLRLRETGSSSSFLSYDFILGTMLHELVHNVHGPHNAAFYALLDKINDELDDFTAKGITGTGQGFDAPSVGRLGAGGFGGHNPSPADLRMKMIQAAEARARTGALMPNGPHRLGGTERGMTPQQAAADAAERRAQDDIGCACGLRSGTDFSHVETVVIEHGELDIGAPSQSLMVGPSSSRAGLRHGQHRKQIGSLNSIASGSGANETFQQEVRRMEQKESQKYRFEKDATEDVVDLTIDSDNDSVQEIV